jgi:hypothetical protein
MTGVNQPGDEVNEKIDRPRWRECSIWADVLELIIDGFDDGSFVEKHFVREGEQTIVHLFSELGDELKPLCDQKLLGQRLGEVALRDVARRTGVSTRTVSNVVNEYPHVTQEKRERVQVALKDLNYQPNLPARYLHKGKVGMLALAIPDLGNPYFSEIGMVSPKAHFFVSRIVVSSLADFLLVLCEKEISHDEDEPHLWATSCLYF